MSKRTKEDICLLFFAVALLTFVMGVSATAWYFGDHRTAYVLGFIISILGIPACTFGIGVVITSPDS